MEPRCLRSLGTTVEWKAPALSPVNLHDLEGNHRPSCGATMFWDALRNNESPRNPKVDSLIRFLKAGNFS